MKNRFSGESHLQANPLRRVEKRVIYASFGTSFFNEIWGIWAWDI